MENIALRFVHNGGNRLKNGLTSLLVEVRQTGTNQAVYINTGIKLLPNQFSEKKRINYKEPR